MPNRFSYLHHQNLRASVDMVSAHHNVCGKQCCTAATRVRGWSHTGSAEQGSWARSAVKGKQGIPPPGLPPDQNTSPDLRGKPGSISVYGQKPSRCSEGFIDPPLSNSASGYTGERQKKSRAKNWPHAGRFYTFFSPMIFSLLGEILHQEPFGWPTQQDIHSWRVSQSRCGRVGSKPSALDSPLGKPPRGRLGNSAPRGFKIVADSEVCRSCCHELGL